MGEDIHVYRDVYKFDYKVKNGVVVKAVRKDSSMTIANGKTDDKSDYKYEFKFKYSKIKAGKTRYFAMINDIVANEETEDAYGRQLLYAYWY